MLTDSRADRGEAIARTEGQIRRVDDGSYYVHSQFGDWEYHVASTETAWICSCPDCVYRGVKCKHVFAVEFSRKVRQAVRADIVIEPVSVSECEFCHSKNLKKFGVRATKFGGVQRFICADCHRTFSVNLGFERMKHNPKAITMAMQLYFNGESLRNTADSLRLLGADVSYQTVWNWIQKYVGLMDRYLDKITPNVSDTWRADEVYVKFKGNRKYVFAMMDDETRFWIAQMVSDHKENTNAVQLFRKSREATGKEPKTLITDALGSYKMASEFEYPRTKHIREIALKGKIHNNKMERMNGEVRDREKVMRGLKRTDTPILRGVQIYHNFIRPHEGLKGETPATKAGIKVEGENKWFTIIQNAAKKD
ncbi:MAG: IS1/IS6 family transposase [Nitrososphaerota archaeon]|nr:IS1/IS6 family transposase [Nitrososphaerota archaeon]MDG7019034.1 IS1/IS6 family transposase [Nitrososphaerota archaeon]